MTKHFLEFSCCKNF